jgi:c-di-GMP-binding flagellar brake protein YcgR
MNKLTNVAQDQNSTFCIESGAKLSIRIEGMKYPAEGIFVGALENEYIVIAPPVSFESMPNGLTQGQKVGVKYLSDGNIFQFQTQFIEIVSKPIRLVLLKYPKSIQKRDLRSRKRINCFIPSQIEIQHVARNDVTHGVLKNISKSGCCCVVQVKKGAKEIFNIDDQIKLKCNFPGIAGQQEVLGNVVNIQKNEFETAVGVQFVNTPWWIPPYV